MTQSFNPGADGQIRIYPRGKKQIYTADFWHNGRHHRKSLKTRNAKVARTRANGLLARLDELIESPHASIKISNAIEMYITYLETEGRRSKTVKKYRGFLKTFDRFCADHGVGQLRKVSITLIDQFRALRKLTHSAKSLHNEGVMLKSFLRWAKQRLLLAVNPMAEMRFRNPPQTPREAPTLEQVDRTLAAASAARRVQLAMLAFTGMRVGELQHLQPGDVDLAGNWIHVISRDGAETKTGFGRKVPIHPRLQPLLKATPKANRPWYFTAAASKKFPTGGHWISTKRLNEDFTVLITKLGLPAGRVEGFTIHSLRHFFETIAVNGGVPQRAIDTWLGHRSDRSMASVYYALRDEESQRFMLQVPFGTGLPAAGAGDKEVSR